MVKLVVILCRQIQPDRWIPVCAGSIFLGKSRRVLVERLFGDASFFLRTDISPFLSPFALRIEEPVRNSRIPQLQTLREPVVKIRRAGKRWHRWQEFLWSEKVCWINRAYLRVEKHGVAILSLIRVAEPQKDVQILERRPQQVGTKNLLIHLRRAGQVNKTMVKWLKSRNRLTKSGIVMSAYDAGSADIAAERRIGVARSKPK